MSEADKKPSKLGITVKSPSSKQVEDAAAEAAKSSKTKTKFNYSKAGDSSSKDADKKRLLMLGLAYGGAAIVTLAVIGVIIYFAVFAPTETSQSELELARMEALANKARLLEQQASEDNKESLRTIKENAERAKETLKAMKEEDEKMKAAQKAAEEAEKARIQALEELNRQLLEAKSSEDVDAQTRLEAEKAQMEQELKELQAKHEEEKRLFQVQMEATSKAFKESLEEIKNVSLENSSMAQELGQLQSQAMQLNQQVETLRAEVLTAPAPVKQHSPFGTIAKIMAVLVLITAVLAGCAVFYIISNPNADFHNEVLNGLRDFVLEAAGKKLAEVIVESTPVDTPAPSTIEEFFAGFSGSGGDEQQFTEDSPV